MATVWLCSTCSARHVAGESGNVHVTDDGLYCRRCWAEEPTRRQLVIYGRLKGRMRKQLEEAEPVSVRIPGTRYSIESPESERRRAAP